MYKTKLEYFRKLHPEKNCFSAITMTSVNTAMISTPILVNMAPFSPERSVAGAPRRPPFDVERALREKRALRDRNGPLRDDPFPADLADILIYNGPAHKLGPSMCKLPQDVVTAKDFYKMDRDMVNEILRAYKFKANALFLFNIDEGYKDYNTSKVMSYQIYFDGRPPLIYDEGHHVELERLGDVYSKQQLKDFPEIVNGLLRENRYLNYTFSGVAASNRKYLFEDINAMVNTLRGEYSFNVCFFQTMVRNHLRNLIDTVSISLYRLEDVIPIFDFKRSVGVAVEVFLTASTNTVSEVSVEGTASTHRFLFSSSKENVFSIDGEPISRPFDTNVESGLRRVYHILDHEVPNDTQLKKYKKGKSKTANA